MLKSKSEEDRLVALNLFISHDYQVDRGSHQLMARFESVPEGAVDLAAVIEDQCDVCLSWVDDKEVVADEADDTERFGDSRYSIYSEALFQLPAHSPATVEEFAELLEASDSLDYYELTIPMPTLVKKSQDLHIAFTPSLVEHEVLTTVKYGTITAVKGFYVSAVDERKADTLSASPEEIAKADVTGISYTRLPAAFAKLRNSHFGFAAMHWWGVIPEAPKLEFYGATKKAVEHLVAIYRASQARKD
jgi:hypothetical protein